MEIRNFEYLLCVGKNVLNNTCDYIQKLFFSKEMCLYQHICDDKTDKGLEIVIDDAVLVCVFENDRCKKTILYFSKPDDIIDCICYCDENYEHNKRKNLCFGIFSNMFCVVLRITIK
ncbi:hypothetical protein [Bacteroides sp.]